MTREDPVLGTVRRCVTCCEWWPDDAQFYERLRGRRRYRSCIACVQDRRHGRPIPTRSVTHGATLDAANKRRRDQERKAALRRDPVLGDKLRARQREAQRRYYQRNREACCAKTRERYASRLAGPVREGFGRPRIAA